ncbi:Retrovirus-related Pol polyprotein from transposon TNT 1-94 [Porphyridium purpureum]|uniref:Retrovirus-related Pol polyprotein from transposon TNT 1-94 n=1 Tax=Porphyridium purpureum TaxID=35688 RepID=A0A5J4YWQ4_PORPP|nr:Retrovirus-related Pol polyprotein from transposon TNT 1-94 [Porphyridium purpureum]|eukprot:POR6811..scf227_4
MAIVDCGATHVFVDKAWVRHSGLLSFCEATPGLQAVLADGRKTNVVGSLLGHLELNGIGSRRCRAIVCPALMTDLVIGMEFLTRTGMVIDYEDGSIFMRKREDMNLKRDKEQNGSAGRTSGGTAGPGREQNESAGRTSGGTAGPGREQNGSAGRTSGRTAGPGREQNGSAGHVEASSVNPQPRNQGRSAGRSSVHVDGPCVNRDTSAGRVHEKNVGKSSGLSDEESAGSSNACSTGANGYENGNMSPERVDCETDRPNMGANVEVHSNQACKGTPLAKSAECRETEVRTRGRDQVMGKTKARSNTDPAQDSLVRSKIGSRHGGSALKETAYPSGDCSLIPEPDSPGEAQTGDIASSSSDDGAPNAIRGIRRAMTWVDRLALGTTVSNVPDGHALLHMPARTSCEVCTRAKLKMRPSYRIDVDAHARAPGVAARFDEEIGVDLVDAGAKVRSREGYRYILTHVDEHTGWIEVAGVVDKTALACREALVECQAGRDWPKRMRTDSGSEFRGAFARVLRERNVEHTLCIPHRPNGHARLERLHHTLNAVIRCLLWQSGLHVVWFFRAAKFFAFWYNRVHLGRDGLTPFERRYGQGWVESGKPWLMAPFGSRVVYKVDDVANKFAPTTREGVVVGARDHPAALEVLETGSGATTWTRDFRVFKDFTMRVPGAEPLAEMEKVIAYDPDGDLAVAQRDNVASEETGIKARVEAITERLKAIDEREKQLSQEVAARRAAKEGKEIRRTKKNARRSARIAARFPSVTINVTRVMSRREATTDGRAAEAIENELGQMRRFGVWDPEPVTLNSITEGLIVRAHMVVAEKHTERPVEERKIKARLVAGGDRITDMTGVPVSLTVPYEAPASLAALRIVLAWAQMNELEVGFVDITSAYLQAECSGGPVYVILPSEAGGKTGTAHHLRKAMYGLPRAGADFAREARSRLLRLGWVEVTAGVYIRRSLEGNAAGLVLVMYVDDVVLAGRKDEARNAMSELYQEFVIDEQPQWLGESPVLHLGMRISRTNGRVKIDGTDYAKTIIDEYERDSTVRTRGTRDAATPMVFPEAALYDEAEVSTTCRQHVGRLMWLARTVKPEIAYSVAYVSRFVDKWSKAASAILDRIVRYVHGSQDSVLEYGSAGRLGDQVRIVAFSDSDHAGCPATRRSTSGGCVYFSNGEENYLVDWFSKAQRASVLSTAEAELTVLPMLCLFLLSASSSYLFSLRARPDRLVRAGASPFYTLTSARDSKAPREMTMQTIGISARV